VSLLGARPITRRRYGVGGYVDGYWVDGTPALDTVDASVQVLKGRDREALPEGVRASDGRKLYLDDPTALQTVQQSAAQRADEVLIDGAWFVVVHVGASHPLIPHVRALVVAIPEGASA